MGRNKIGRFFYALLLSCIMFIAALFFLVVLISLFDDEIRGVGSVICFAICAFFVFIFIKLKSRGKNSIGENETAQTEIYEQENVFENSIKAVPEKVEKQNDSLNQFTYANKIFDTENSVKAVPEKAEKQNDGLNQFTYANKIFDTENYIEIAPEKEEKQNDSLNQFNDPARKKPFDYANKIFEIEYLSRDGETTQRKIEVRNFYFLRDGKEPYDIYLQAFCFLRDEMRTFKLENIEKAFENGKEIFMPVDFFMSIYNGDSSSYKQMLLLHEHDAEVKLLVFMARSDGRMMKNEREAIARYVARYDSGADLARIDSAIKNIYCDTREFNKILKMNFSSDVKQNIMEAAAEIFTCKKNPDEMEKAAFAKIKKACKID